MTATPPLPPADVPPGVEFLAGGGAMAELIRRHDWSRTPLGPLERWPQSLRAAVSIALGSKFPILIWWGREHVKIYNDAYAAIIVNKHPRALGQPGRECWPEIWPVIGPMLEGVLSRGEATWSDDQLLVLNRNGYLEECYFTFSYSAIHDETGGVGGIFTAVTETTARVIGERRLRTLRDLAEEASHARSDVEACEAAVRVLDAARADVPFAALYLFDAAGTSARLVGVTGLVRGGAAAPEVVDLTAGPAAWPLTEVLTSEKPQLITGLAATLGELPGGPWPAPADAAIVLPIADGARERTTAILVAGLSPRRALDDSYRTFYELAGTYLATAIASARAHAEERRRSEALAELDRAKTAFLGNVSHEFRTPLTLLLAPLQEALTPGGASREALEIAHRNALRLLKLVNSLLDFSRIEAGRVEAVYEPVDLAALTADLASVFRSAIERGGLVFEVDSPPLPATVCVDREMWEKILLNLLSNALKFTFEGAIRVAVRADGGEAVLEVRDTGIGIAPEDQARVFERFQRVRDARARTHEGAGIGLALVQELVRLHGGRVTVESEVGRGSTFTVRVPFGVDHLPVERIGIRSGLPSTAVAAASYVEEAFRWLEEEAPPPVRVAPATAGARVLLADDNADMRDYIHRLLAAHWDIEVAANGVAALAAATRRTPDLVLADVMMPGMDGFELLRRLRADEATRTVPIILLSARAGEEARVEGLDAGADDYLVKPFFASELVARVNAHLSLARVRRESLERARLDAEVIKQERQRAEALLAELSDFFEHAAIAIRWVGPDGIVVRANRAELELLGYTEAEYVGRPIADFHADADEAADIFERLAAGESLRDHPARLRCKDGSVKDVLVDANVRFEGGRFVHTRAFTRDMTALRTAQAELGRLLERERQARAEAEAANRSKDEFLAVLSHELRTPLNAILGWARILTTAPYAGDALPRGLETIERNAHLQAQLVDDLLDISRIVAGKLALDVVTVDVGTVIDDALASVAASARAKDVTIDREGVGDAAVVTGDASRLQQVVWNLLSNAIKFTPSGGRVTVRLSATDETVEIAVRDTGRGIDPAFLPHVFERFRQADSTTTRGQGGLGLGLAIVRHLVELHGGVVRAESEGDGRGATFVVRLPRGAASDRLVQRPAEVVPRGQLSGVRVLVVEDDVDSRDMLVAALGGADAAVSVAASADEATGAIRDVDPHVLISDIGMPGEDGYTLIGRVRAMRRDGKPRIAAIALTAHARPEDRLKSLLAGFDVHVNKPIDPHQLVRVVARLTGIGR